MKILTDLFMTCRTQESLIIRKVDAMSIAKFIDEIDELLAEPGKRTV